MKPCPFKYIIYTAAVILTACSSNNSESVAEVDAAYSEVSRPAAGYWRGVLELSDTVTRELPFQFVMDGTGNDQTMVIQNAGEAIVLNKIVEKNDNLEIVWPVFESGFVVSTSDSTMSGYWYDLSRGTDYKIPFNAQLGSTMRFPISGHPAERLSGKWRTHFGNDEANALGIFNMNQHVVMGSFATETGDYRYLEGVVVGNQFKLSTLDGAHAFLFEGTIDGDSLWGTFYSGDHYSEPFYAVLDDGFTLRDANELTFLKEGYESISFAFPSVNGDTVRLSDPEFEHKAVIVQLFGSWCPNCMDETKYLVDLYEEEYNNGLRVVGLGFERHSDYERASRAVIKMRQDLLIPYPLLIAGRASKTEAAEKLPMLNHVMSFPTAIVLDRNHNVVGIHTGFYGPGTGTYYKEFKKEFEEMVDKALARRPI